MFLTNSVKEFRTEMTYTLNQPQIKQLIFKKFNLIIFNFNSFYFKRNFMQKIYKIEVFFLFWQPMDSFKRLIEK